VLVGGIAGVEIVETIRVDRETGNRAGLAIDQRPGFTLIGVAVI
jgi:hypothetical protein